MYNVEEGKEGATVPYSTILSLLPGNYLVFQPIYDEDAF
jgi:hypothetical protein